MLVVADPADEVAPRRRGGHRRRTRQAAAARGVELRPPAPCRTTVDLAGRSPRSALAEPLAGALEQLAARARASRRRARRGARRSVSRGRLDPGHGRARYCARRPRLALVVELGAHAEAGEDRLGLLERRRASRTAAASRAGAGASPPRGRRRTTGRPTGESSTVRRPSRIGTRRSRRARSAAPSRWPRSARPRRRASSRSTASGVRPQVAEQAAARPRPRRARSSTSAGRSSPSQPAPNTAPHARARGHARAPRRAARRRHSGLASAGLVAVGEHVAADVDAARRGRSPARGGRVGEAGGDRGGPPGWGRRARSARRAARPCRTRRSGSRRARACPGPASATPSSQRLGAGRPRRGAAGRGAGRSAGAPRSCRRATRLEPGVAARCSAAAERADDVAAAADADGRGRAAAPADRAAASSVRRAPGARDERRRCPRRSRAISSRRALELVVGEHRGALEREVARDLEPRAAAAELVPDLDGHRARDAVGAQQDDVERVAALPRQALLGVVRRPDVVRRQRVDRARVGDRPVARRPRPTRGCGRGRAGRCRRRASAPRRAARRRPTRPPRARDAARAGATRARGRCAGGRTWDRGRSGRARARSACSARGTPPLRRVTSCSPSASARTVTAHSLKAIGIGKRGKKGGKTKSIPRTEQRRVARPRDGTSLFQRDREIQNAACQRSRFSETRRTAVSPPTGAAKRRSPQANFAASRER